MPAPEQTPPAGASPERLRVYDDRDCDPALIRGMTVAVIGYGSQGHAHALNLRDSGVNVIAGLRERSSSADKAAQAGFEVASPAESAARADLVMMLIPDEHQADVYARDLAPHMKKGAALGFAHGLNIHFRLIAPHPDLDVVMIAPKGTGPGVRAEYVRGSGVPAIVAVHQDRSGRALDLALSYAAALGCGRTGILQATFREECETDLFGEQAVLCGGISHLVRAGFETLVEAGYPPEMAYFECLHETKLVVDLLCRGGLDFMNRAISNTAEYGSHVAGPRIVNDGVKAEMKKILAEIQSGKFVNEFMGGNREGLLRLGELRAAAALHPAEEVGVRLRAMMAADKKDPNAGTGN